MVTEEERNAIAAEYDRLKTLTTNLQSQAADMRMQVNEHDHVIRELNDLPDDRVCYRQSGEVLQKFTVDAVRPVLSSNRDQIKAVADKIAEEQQKKEQALAEFISKHNIRIQN